MSSNFNNIEDLYLKVKERIDSRDSSSYSVQLNEEGLEKINRKVGEEAIEVIIAALLIENLLNSSFEKKADDS